jgi:hypothetical protein
MYEEDEDNANVEVDMDELDNEENENDENIQLLRKTVKQPVIKRHQNNSMKRRVSQYKTTERFEKGKFFNKLNYYYDYVSIKIGSVLKDLILITFLYYVMTTSFISNLFRKYVPAFFQKTQIIETLSRGGIMAIFYILLNTYLSIR